jgi:Rrf2 family nitric oxide-sensitive transcriptional repressor
LYPYWRNWILVAMRLSAYSDYAFRVLMQAALRMPQRITVDQVAETFGISRHHLIKVAHDLGRSGYLQTQRGVGSGFTLGRAPHNIRIGDIVRLGEESEAVIDCMDRQGFPCRVFPSCQLRGVLDEATSAFSTVLDRYRYTLADLIKQPSKMRAVLQL